MSYNISMKRLSRDHLAVARTFLFERGRPLEMHQYLYLFAKLPVDQTLIELAGYQNADGGFGNALEPDLRCGESSALATSVAFQVMHRCNIDRDHELMRSAIRYLTESLEPNGQGWRIIPDSARSSDSAPWWTAPPDEANQQAALNPTAELLGYLIQYASDDAGDQIEPVGDFVIRSLEADPETPLESHDLLCIDRLARLATNRPRIAELARQRVQRDAPKVVMMDPAKWGGYGLMPLWLADRSDAPAAQVLGEEILNTNLDYELARQANFGCWEPSWDWGPDNRASWELAKSDWQGVLTFQTLLALRAFGRIEQSPIDSA